MIKLIKNGAIATLVFMCFDDSIFSTPTLSIRLINFFIVTKLLSYKFLFSIVSAD